MGVFLEAVFCILLPCRTYLIEATSDVVQLGDEKSNERTKETMWTFLDSVNKQTAVS